jgi:hypothetical protein
VLGAGAGAAVLALAAGCSVAPPGATYDSAAVGPVRSGPAGTQNFAPFPVPAIWSGENNATFEMVVKAKTGTVSPGGFRFIVAPNMVFWLNCIGAGKAQLASAGIKLKWSVPCGDGTSPGGINFRPASSAVGHADEVYVTVSAGSRWEVRIDAIASAGVSPVRGQVRRLSGAGPPPPGRHPLM